MEAPVTIRQITSIHWADENGNVYIRNNKGVFYPLQSQKPRNWFQKLFNI